MEITKDKVTELFCIIDEFLLAYVHTQRFQYVLPQPYPTDMRKSFYSLSGIVHRIITTFG